MSVEPSEVTAEELLERKQEIEELTEHIEEKVRKETEERLYFSMDISSLTDQKVSIDVYGVEDYPMPSKASIAGAVAEFYDWEMCFEERMSDEDRYTVKVLDFDRTEPVF